MKYIYFFILIINVGVSIFSLITGINGSFKEKRLNKELDIPKDNKNNKDLSELYLEGRYNFRILIGIFIGIYLIFSYRAQILYVNKDTIWDAYFLLTMGIIPYIISLLVCIMMFIVSLGIKDAKTKQEETIYFFVIVFMSLFLTILQIIQYKRLFLVPLIITIITFLIMSFSGHKSR